MLFPLFLRLEGRRVLVVGGGPVAERKVLDLEAAGARVLVVAPATTAAIDALESAGRVTVERRPFAATDVAGTWLVVAATDDPAVQAVVCRSAEDARIFAIAVDDPPNGTAISASVVRRAPFTVAISSSGEVPALARLLREVLEQALPDEEWVEAARDLRARWRAEGTPMASRFADLVRAFKERAG
jgi:siroheme synthase-like protein